ncbi:MAG: NapC/NirT family cytochrome c [Thiocapsa sp.]|jgi:predicted CXXCH cytochrome family protein|nr:NapC/NirT family cytochrome c [Thiocapsa sp.]MCG6896214.1 NapC/NirT family cytochrome c [Thiocapsa sp.]MCG6983678.1 NapC/NirT family cytochrome c [Thiocapsa sp.]
MTRTLKWLGLAAGLLILVSIAMAGGWILTEGAIQSTSDREFCTTCHSMEPFAEAYDRDVHGGRNPGGVAAGCTDCHLPHESPARYLAAKVRTGIHDGWAELGGRLDGVGLRRDAAWLRLYFTDPKAAIPTATMPKAALTEQQLADLIAYLISLR